jgi:hypothetical protein
MFHILSTKTRMAIL